MTIKRQSNGHVISNYCFICGGDQEEPILQEAHCYCCGVYVGYWSINPYPEDVISYRDDWFNNNCQFNLPRLKPKVWNKELAIAQIKQNVPEEFWNNDPMLQKNLQKLLKHKKLQKMLQLIHKKIVQFLKLYLHLLKKCF